MLPDSPSYILAITTIRTCTWLMQWAPVRVENRPNILSLTMREQPKAFEQKKDRHKKHLSGQKCTGCWDLFGENPGVSMHLQSSFLNDRSCTELEVVWVTDLRFLRWILLYWVGHPVLVPNFLSSNCTQRYHHETEFFIDNTFQGMKEKVDYDHLWHFIKC